MNAIEINCETGEVIERPLTAEEIAANEAAAAQAAAEAHEAEVKAAADAEAKAALLAKLGITADEAKLLLA
jgi:membrane protein involved in colicin uptake